LVLRLIEEARQQRRQLLYELRARHGQVGSGIAGGAEGLRLRVAPEGEHAHVRTMRSVDRLERIGASFMKIHDEERRPGPDEIRWN
jgi:hypothetical protein